MVREEYGLRVVVSCPSIAEESDQVSSRTWTARRPGRRCYFVRSEAEEPTGTMITLAGGGRPWCSSHFRPGSPISTPLSSKQNKLPEVSPCVSCVAVAKAFAVFLLPEPPSIHEHRKDSRTVIRHVGFGAESGRNSACRMSSFRTSRAQSEFAPRSRLIDQDLGSHTND